MRRRPAPHLLKMRFLLPSRLVVALSIVAAFGCGSHETGTVATVPPKPLDPAVAAQQRAAVMQTLSTMTPDQRAAYLQAHPDAMQALKPPAAP